jgi:hypothetical protein
MANTAQVFGQQMSWWRLVNLESETPYFYWTFNRLGDLEQSHNQYGFDGSVWKSDVISSYSTGEADLTFESSAKWADGLPPATFHRTLQGHYEHRSKGIIYDAVRADTRSHVVLTGRWSETEFGSGVFIAVLPLKQDVRVLLRQRLGCL